VKILSIDGGGIRGLIPALVLAAFETRTGQSVAKHFDFIAGTSTGGIVALGLAAGIPAMCLAEFYQERGPAIFSRSLKKRLESLGGLADELYDAGELELALADLFGDRRLSDVETRSMAVAYDIEQRETVLFRSWGNADYRLADVARATSAAPCYFEPFAIPDLSGRILACVDGGVVANNPSLLAFSEAEGPHFLVSIGTGRRERPIALHEAVNFGAAQWAPHLLDIIFSGQAELAHQLCRSWLGSNYVRLQVELPEDVPMDATDARAFAVMRLAARRLAESAEATQALQLVEAA